MIRYCTRCLLPATKPDLHIDEEGVCSACRYYEQRPTIDWAARRKELVQVLEQHRAPNGTNWDCIVPVSGGKDSTCQVLTILELGFNPLCVMARTCDLSDIGRHNIDNLRELGVDVLEFATNPHVRRKLNRIGLLQVGDISWPEHVSIFTIPVRIAVQFGIQILIWGENPQSEYGGPTANAYSRVLDRRWLEEFGGLLGLRVSDMVGIEELSEADLLPFTYPSAEDLTRVGVTGLFTGHFLPWDGYSNALLSQAHGFRPYHDLVEGSIVPYENVDNHQTGIHDYFKYLKYGFCRSTDIASLHIRRGRLSRAQGLELVKMHDGRFPWTYLGKPLAEILKPLRISVPEFVKICDRFTNKKLFVTDSRGNLVKDEEGNLSKINYDNQ